MKLKTFPRGIHIRDNKDFTADFPVKPAVIPKKVRIPVSQHFGKPADPIVKPGDLVKTGTLIAASAGPISGNIHSSVSGKVISIGAFPHPLGRDALAVEIESDGRDDKEDLAANSDIIQAVQNAGIVGMGGAMFPSHVKLQPPKDKKIDSVILNGAECEPFVTCDYRLMVESAGDIVEGLKIIKKVLGVENAYIGIESNKPEAIRLLSEKARGVALVVALKPKYPQGGEKQLIKAVLSREVPSGGLPFDAGAVVFNVATSAAIYEAVAKRKPLYERIVTIAGSAVNNPGNYKVRIGTLFSDIIELKDTPERLIVGGPMMGFSQYTFDAPVIKGTNALLVFKKGEIKLGDKEICIRCGKCIASCPMGLWPGRIADLAEKGRYEEAKAYGLKDCIECGICGFLCPSNRDIIQFVRYGKQN